MTNFFKIDKIKINFLKTIFLRQNLSKTNHLKTNFFKAIFQDEFLILFLRQRLFESDLSENCKFNSFGF